MPLSTKVDSLNNHPAAIAAVAERKAECEADPFVHEQAAMNAAMKMIMTCSSVNPSECTAPFFDAFTIERGTQNFKSQRIALYMPFNLFYQVHLIDCGVAILQGF